MKGNIDDQQHFIIMNNQANETIFANWTPFISREVEKITTNILQNKPYDQLRSQQQIEAISKQIVDKLVATNKNFKYIIHVTLVARGGNGLDVGGLTYWNPEMDGSVNIKWQNKFLTCITTVYGIAN